MKISNDPKIIIVSVALLLVVVYYINSEQNNTLENPMQTRLNSVNNPGNIRRRYKDSAGNWVTVQTNFLGEIDSPSYELKSFSSMPYGFRAMVTIIKNYYYSKGDKNFYQIIDRYSGGENSFNYVSFIEQSSGINAYIDAEIYIINPGYMEKILTAMALWEQGRQFAVNSSDVVAGISLA